MRPIHAARAALTLLAFTSASSVLANIYADQVDSHLQTRYEYWHDRDNGWTRLRNLRQVTTLKEGYGTIATLKLVEGETYKIMGACDDDCTGMDFILRDDNGDQVDSDVGIHNLPIVEVTPARNSAFTLEVRMRKCASDAGCELGVDVYRGR